MIAKKTKIQVNLRGTGHRMSSCEFSDMFEAAIWAMTLPTDGAYTVIQRNGNGSLSSFSVFNDDVNRIIKPFEETRKPSCVIPLSHQHRKEILTDPRE